MPKRTQEAVRAFADRASGRERMDAEAEAIRATAPRAVAITMMASTAAGQRTQAAGPTLRHFDSLSEFSEKGPCPTEEAERHH